MSETATVAIGTASQTSATTGAPMPPAAVETNSQQPLAPVCSVSQEITASTSAAAVPLAAGSMINARPGSMVRVPEMANGRKLIIILRFVINR